MAWIVFTCRHHFLKSKTKEPPKFLFTAQQCASFRNPRILNFRVMAVRDKKLRSHLSKKNVYTHLMILSFLKSQSISKSTYVYACLFSTDNQSPTQPFAVFSGRHIYSTTHRCTIMKTFRRISAVWENIHTPWRKVFFIYLL